MTSLRTRIAASYAILLVGVVVAIAIALNFAFQSILYQEVLSRAQLTADDVARAGTSVLSLLDEPIELELANQYNLDHWSAPSTYVQVDTPHGDLLAKSSNMGGARFPAPGPLKPGTERVTTLRDELGSLLVLDRPIVVRGKLVAIVTIGEKLDLIHAALARAQTILLVVAIVASLAIVVLAYFVARSATEPIARLTKAIDEIGSDRLDRRLAWSGPNDEVGRLAATFDAMLGRLAEAFVRERQFISDASHELKTPLTVINANAQMLARWADRDPQIRAESLQAIIAESAALAQMVNGMLTLAKAASGDDVAKEPLPLDALAREAVQRSEERAHAKGLALRYTDDDPRFTPLVMGDENLLRQLVGNLVDNAIKFTESGGIDVRSAIAGGSAIVEVADTGPGMAPEVAERIFDRFFRGDASHSRAVEGTGLGLAIVRSIARIHGGTVSVAPRPGGGSIFRVVLPLLEAIPKGDPSIIESS